MEQLELPINEEFRQATHQHKACWGHFYKCDPTKPEAYAMTWCDTFNRWYESAYLNRQIIFNSNYVEINNENN